MDGARFDNGEKLVLPHIDYMTPITVMRLHDY